MDRFYSHLICRRFSENIVHENKDFKEVVVRGGVSTELNPDYECKSDTDLALYDRTGSYYSDKVRALRYACLQV